LILSARTLLLTPRVLVDLFSVLAPRPPSSPLFPYTTLFRSESDRAQPCDEGVEVGSTVVGQEDLAGRTRIERQSFADRQGVLRSDRKSTRLNSSHVKNSYAVFCLKTKTTAPRPPRRNSSRRT